MRKTRIAISLGDPAGISPEIIAETLVDRGNEAEVLVVGHWPSLKQALSRVGGHDLPICMVDTIRLEPGRVAVLPVGPGGLPITTPGKESARAQFEALQRAVDAMLTGEFDALVTGPVAKNAIATLAPDFTGHTSYLARRAGLATDDVTMVFSSDNLFVGLVSIHIPLREVSDAMTPKRIRRTFGHLREMVQRTHPSTRPRIGVAALNPHAGEDGLFGNEETDMLIPFCREASRDSAVEVVGPLPADTIYREALAGRLDAVVAAYHDQAMIPLKLGGVGQMVNVTMGLPFIRTSPDHGVAYDIAGTGKADATGFRLAFDLACRLRDPKTRVRVA